MLGGVGVTTADGIGCFIHGCRRSGARGHCFISYMESNEGSRFYEGRRDTSRAIDVSVRALAYLIEGQDLWR